MGGKSTSTSPTRLNQIAVQSSSLGLPITVGWGRARINNNLLWYGGFNAIAHTTKQSGGKGLGGSVSSTSYSYTASIVLGLCEGGTSGVQGVRTVYRDKAALSLSASGLSLATGLATQSTWSYLTSKFPTQAINYSGIAYVYAQDYALNDSATLPNHSFEVDFGIQLSGATNGDADPKDIVTDFLTNSQYGVPQWPSGALGDLSNWSLYCRASNLLLSPVLDSQRSGSDFLSEIATATNSEFVWSEGVLKVGTYGDSTVTGNGVTWTPNLTPAYDLTEDDFIPVDGKPVKLEIVDQSDAYNIVQVEFLDRANQYNAGIMPAQDLANIVQYGRRKQDPTTLHSICDAGIAQQSAQLLLQRTLYTRERYTFTIPDCYGLLEPMIDMVTLTTTTDELQLNRRQVRIEQIDENADGTLAITARGMDIGTASAALYNAHSASGYVPNLDVAPGSVSAPVLFNAPTSLTGGVAELWIAAAGTNPNWGGCDVWISADGTLYQKVGSITAAARLGVSTAVLAAHADPDTTNTLSVDLTNSAGSLQNSNASNANVGSTLALIGNEIVSYQTAALTGTYTYNLTNLRRGLYGTTPGSHASGQPFARLDDAVFEFAYGSLALGSTAYVKLPSFNVFGRALEDISTVTAYTVSLSMVGAGLQVSQGSADGISWHAPPTTSDVYERFSSDGGVTFGPTITIGGPGSIVPYLTKETASVAADSSGTVSSFSGTGGTMDLIQGTSIIGSGVTFSVVSGSTTGGLSISINSSSGAYTISALTSDQGTATLRATYGGVNYDKVYTLAKQKQGSAGSNGLNGSNGYSGLSIAISPGAISVGYSSTGSIKTGQLPVYLDTFLFDAGTDVHTSASYSVSFTNCSGSINNTSGSSTRGRVTVSSISSTNCSFVVTATMPDGRVISAGAAWAGAYDGNTGNDGTGQFTLVNRAGMTITGRTVTNTGGSGSWGSASVTSAEGFYNGAACSFTTVDASHEMIVGLNSDPTTDNSYDTIDYGIVLRTTGAWEIWENGSYVGVTGSYSAGAVFQVVYTGLKVTYLGNGNVLRTVSASAGATLYLDSSFTTLGGSITNITFAKAGADGTTTGAKLPSVAVGVSDPVNYPNPITLENGQSIALSYSLAAGAVTGAGCTIHTWIEYALSGSGSWNTLSGSDDTESYSTGDPVYNGSGGTLSNTSGARKAYDVRYRYTKSGGTPGAVDASRSSLSAGS